MIRRKNYFIKKSFQVNFMSRFVALLLIESLLIAGFFMYMSTNTITTGYSGSVLKVARTPDFFLISFLIMVGIVVIGVGLIGMVIFILLSHRIAGPLFRFERTLKDMESGDFTARINLRKTDQMTAFKEAMNFFMDSMDRRIANIKTGVTELKKLISRKDDPEVGPKINKIIDSLESEVKHFKVTSDQRNRG